MINLISTGPSWNVLKMTSEDFRRFWTPVPTLKLDVINGHSSKIGHLSTIQITLVSILPSEIQFALQECSIILRIFWKLKIGLKNRKTALFFCIVPNVWKELLSILYNPDRMQRKVFFYPLSSFLSQKRTLIKSPFLVLLDGCRNLSAFWRPRLHSSSYFCKDRRQSELNTPQILFWLFEGEFFLFT